MKATSLLNRRVIFKLRGMDPLDSILLKQDEGGYWIRGGTLAGHLKQANCSLPESDVRYLEFSRVEWVRPTRKRS